MSDKMPMCTSAVMTQFRQAAMLFDRCEKPAHSGKCLAAAGDWGAAATRFRAAQHWNEAAVAMLRAGSPSEAAVCFEEGGQWLQALKAWDAATQPTKLMRAARKALEISGAGREEALSFVRRALDALSDQQTILEAARLLGAPCCEGKPVIDFLANDMGAESAALRLMDNESAKDRTALAYRAFHRSFLRGATSWASFPAELGSSRGFAVLAILYGLELSDTATVGADGLPNAVRDKLPSSRSIKISERLTCIALPKGALSNLQQSLTLGTAWEIAPATRVCAAAHAEVAMRSWAEEYEKIKNIKDNRCAHSTFGILCSALAVPFLSSSTLRKLACNFAKEVWAERGPLGASNAVPSNAAAALISAAQTTWTGPEATNGSVEHTFAILAAGGASTYEVFLELRGARKHAALVDYVAALRSGAVFDAAQVLATYLDSPAAAALSRHFITMLASYLAGPITVAMRPADGAFVLPGLIWSWPEQLQAKPANANEALQELLPQLCTIPVSGGCSGRPQTKTKRSLPVVTIDLREDVPEARHEEKRAANFAVGCSPSLQEATEVQFSCSLGIDIPDTWWAESWSNEWHAGAAATPEHITVCQTLRRKEQHARRRAGIKIASWLAERWNMWQRREVWPAVCDVAASIRSLRLVPSASAAALLQATVDFTEEKGLSASALRALARETAGHEQELMRRAEGIAVREEAELNREARERAREEKRRKGEKKQEHLERKAAKLRMQRGGAGFATGKALRRAIKEEE
jgi:hypothetical protein